MMMIHSNKWNYIDMHWTVDSIADRFKQTIFSKTNLKQTILTLQQIWVLPSNQADS